MIATTPIALLLLLSPILAGELAGEHVCQDEERYLVNVTRHFVRNITVREYEWCLQVPPRCSTYKLQQINDSRTVEEERVKYVKVCCSGFKPSHNREFCVSESCPNCVNGFCNNTESCDCEPGYQGIDCSRECNTGFWGKDCSEKCNCGDQGICNKRTGKCYCPPIQHFNGLRCEPTCSRDKPDHKCKFQCICFPIKENSTSTEETTIISEEGETTLIPFQKEEPESEELASRELGRYHMENPYLWKSIRRSSSYPFSYFTTEVNKPPPTMRGFDIFAKPNESFDKTQTEKVQFSVDVTVSAKTIETTTTYSIEYDEKNATLEVERSNLDSLVIDSRLFITVLCAVLFSVLVILVAAAFCVLHKLKERKRKCEMKIRKEQEAAGTSNIQSVSVTARSIFHTPLPEPPTFNNPIFSLPIDTNFQPNAIEVVCNMNFPKSSTPKQDDFCYDHPPSTGSYRAASIPEPPEKLTTFDPIYDEIPNSKKQTTLSPPPSYVSEKCALYMNTR